MQAIEYGIRNSRAARVAGAGGFTLLELLAVVAIIGILAGIMLPAVMGFQKKVRIKRAESEARSLATAIRAYHTEYNYWPVDVPLRSVGGVWSNNNEKVLAYLVAQDINKNPHMKNFFELTNSAASTLRDPFVSNQAYRVQINVVGNAVTVWSTGPDGRDGSGDEISVTY